MLLSYILHIFYGVVMVLTAYFADHKFHLAL